MENQITGKVIAVSPVQQVQSKQAGAQPKEMRQLLLDCTRFDPYTGERSQYENTPMLDFKGENMKLLDGIQAGDVVTITFDVNGYRYKDEKDGKTKVFTSIRPYKLVKRVKQQQGQGTEGQQISVQPQGQQQAAAPVPGIGNDLPFI